jgi:PAS domain S-box-containing protein
MSDSLSAAAASDRLAALRGTGLLDSAAEESFDRLARLACRLLDAPITLVSLVDGDRQFFKSQCGLPEPWASRRETPLSHSFCQHVVERAEPLIVGDASQDERLRDNPALGEMGIVAYAGIPLVDAGGQVLGSFCAIDHRPRHWTDEQVGVLTDLAASAQTEIHLRDALRSSRQRGDRDAEARRQFEELVQGLDAIVWEMDVASFRFSFVSQRAEELLGYPVSRWVDEPTFWQDVLLHPEDRDWALGFCQTATADGRDHDFEYRVVRADGEVVWLRDLVRVVCDDDGTACQLRGVMIDVSEEKAAVEELRKREAQLAEAQTVARIGSWELEIATGALTWSDESYRLCGLEPQSVTLTTESFLDLIHPDDRERVGLAIEGALLRGEPYCVEARLVHADGSVRHAQMRGEAATDRHGRPVRLRGTAQDITERKQAEEARLAAERAAHAMAARMRAVTGAAAGVIGADSVDALQRVLREECAAVIPFDAFTMALYDPRSHTLSYLEGYDAEIVVPARIVAIDGTPGEQVVRSRRSLVTRRSEDPQAAGSRPIGTGRRSESIIRTPIVSGERVLGVISVQSYTPEMYGEPDIEVLEAVASLAATALLNLELLAQREAATEALGLSESKFKALFEESPDAIFLLDGQVFVDCNQAALELMRCSGKDQILGRHPASLSADFQADGAESYAQADGIMAAAFEQGSVVFEWLIRRADGEVFPSEVAITAYPLEDKQVLHVVARDITARKRAEEALLRANEELEQRVAERTAELQQRTAELEGVFRALPDLFFRLSPEATVLPHRSELDARLYQAPPEFVGRSLSEMLAAVLEHEDDRARIHEAVERIRRTGEVVSVEYPLPTDGEPREFEARLVKLEDGSMIAVARDITDRKEAERELQRREEHFRRLTENAHDMVAVTTPEGRIRYVSPSAERILGYTPEEMLGMSSVDLIHPDDLAAAERNLSTVISNPGLLHTSLIRHRHKDGSWRVLEVLGRTLSPTSAEEGIVVNSRDVTDRIAAEEELRRREEHFRRLIENSHDLVVVVDGTNTVLYVSPSVERILGYAPEEWIGQSGSMRTHPDDLEHGLAKLAEVTARPGTTITAEFRVLHKDGSWRVMEVYSRTLSLDSADEGVVVNARDITERKEFDRALQERETRFRRLTENSSDLVQIIYPDSRMGYTGPSVVHLLGYTPEEVAGLSNMDFIHPDDHQAVTETIQAIFSSPGASRSVRYRVRHKDGRWRVFEAFGRTLLPDSADEGLVCNARDITERHEAERALRRREEHFRRLIENAYDMVLVIDAAGTITYASPSAQRVLGTEPEELTGRSGFSVVHPDDVDTALARTTETLATPGAVVSAELRFRHRDGSYRILETFCRTLADDSAASGIVVNARDITERRQFEEALQQSEARYRSLIENAHDIVTILDLDGRIMYQSPQVERVLGYDPQELLGHSALDLVHPEDVATPAEALQQILATPGSTFTSEYRFRHKDGTWRYMETFGRTLVPDSPEQGLVFNTRDVTERREAQRLLQEREEHFRKLIETSHDLVQTLDAQGNIVYTGPSVERLLGYTPEEISGQGAPDFIHKDDHARVTGKIVDALTNPGKIIHLEYRVLHKDGRWRWFEAIGRTLSSETAELGMVANARDITDRKRAEEALRHATEEAERAREAAERANRAKSEFLSRMSHELRTPMNSILGFAQLLDRAPLPPEHKKGVGHILKAGRHLLQLINEVLEIARIEAGRHSLSLEPVRAGTVLQEAVALVRPLAAQWRVELEEGPWPCCSAYVQADRQRLTQVLLNLLGNAIKYNRAGGRVRISCETAADGERQRLALRVEDTGRGIDPDKADQLFTPFARLGAEQSEVEGTGLGLALSQRLTEAMGGTLTLERSGPEGSVFRLELQITDDPLQRLEDPAGTATSLDGVPHAPATLLYIEDNLANLSLVETILLSRPQWRTMPALQGQIGVELAREHTPDLILLDLHLPDISGEEVLRRLRSEERTASIPIVVITADATRSTTDRLRAAGADAYLTKPLDIDEFLETLERFLPSPK